VNRITLRINLHTTAIVHISCECQQLDAGQPTPGGKPCPRTLIVTLIIEKQSKPIKTSFHLRSCRSLTAHSFRRARVENPRSFKLASSPITMAPQAARVARALKLRIIRRLGHPFERLPGGYRFRPGWTRYEVVRQTGKTKGKVDRYFKAPAGHVIRSFIKASIYAAVLEDTDDADLAFDAIDRRG
jgi:hypothetical protein